MQRSCITAEVIKLANEVEETGSEINLREV